MSIRDVLAAASSSTALASRDVQWMYFSDSRTFTPQYDMEVIIHVLGSSGTGGVAASTGGSNASGAGAGGYAIKRATLKAGVTYTITIGAGGANNGANANAGRFNGNDGSPTSFVGGTINIVANGGKGGASTVTNVAAPGGAGGTATGGDKNYTGGRGGNIAANATVVGAIRMTGGGALNLFGTGNCNGGDLTGTTLSTSIVQSTGGGSCIESGVSSNSITTVSTGAGGLDLIGGNISTAVTLLNRSIFGLYNSIGPSGGGTPGDFGGGTGAAAPRFGGGGGISGGGTSGANQGTPGGAVATSGAVSSASARPGFVALEILG